MFSCEIVPYKQDFIKAFARPPLLFADVSCLGDDRAADVLSGCFRHVPFVDVVIAGFACTDVSRMNSAAGSSRDCVRKRSLRTGGTFAGVYDYVKSMGPPVVILENVMAIDDKGKDGGSSNADAIIGLLQGAGYTVDTTGLEPHGSRCSPSSEAHVVLRIKGRSRISQLSKSCGLNACGFRPRPSAATSSQRVTQRLLQWAHQARPEHVGSRRGRRPTLAHPAALAWKPIHQRFFRAAGLAWPPVLESRVHAGANEPAGRAASTVPRSRLFHRC